MAAVATFDRHRARCWVEVFEEDHVVLAILRCRRRLNSSSARPRRRPERCSNCLAIAAVTAVTTASDASDHKALDRTLNLGGQSSVPQLPET